MCDFSSLRRELLSLMNSALLCLVAVTALYLSPAHAAEDPIAQGRTGPLRPNFEGTWEKDFARSDKMEDELRRTIDELNREVQRQQSRGDGGSLSSGGGRRAGNIVAHARLAELISRQTTMQIIQTASEIRIERNGDAALVCSTQNNMDDTFTSVHGSEYCGWDRQQLVFEITLSEGVVILHRFSVDPDGQTLSMLTSISSRNSVPFNLIQFFNRYDAPGDGYSCVQTLSRGRVCTAIPPAETTP